MSNLAKSIHRQPKLLSFSDKMSLVRGNYDYYHYGCDGKDDRGWGCGYRTLQSLCSWVNSQRDVSEWRDVPSLDHVQEALVKMGDKKQNFINSREWIGSFEVCLCLDFFYDVPCKILHIGSGQDLLSHLTDLRDHFVKFGSPIMMGGDTDASSKGILGVSMDSAALLVMDPHFYSRQAESASKLAQDGWIKWVPVEQFTETNFYNLCLPQLVAKDDG